MIMESTRCRNKNLFMAWIDLTLCLIAGLELYKVHPKICSFVSSVMQHWKVSLYCTDQYYGEVDIMRGIYQGDSLSSLLFALAVMPVSDILNNTDKGFVLEKNGLIKIESSAVPR